jgi:hypothetical protein
VLLAILPSRPRGRLPTCQQSGFFEGASAHRSPCPGQRLAGQADTRLTHGPLMAEQDDKSSRAEAIRRLVELGLKANWDVYSRCYADP